MILIGHYAENATINDDVKNIIRILGENPNKPGYFLSQDSKNYSEHELNNNWTFLDTSITSERKKLPKSIFSGILEITDETPAITDETTAITENPVVVEKIEEVSDYPKISEENRFILNIIDKIRISKENEKYQTNKKPNQLKISFDIDLDFDIIKLKNLIKFLNLNINDVVSAIISEKLFYMDKQFNNLFSDELYKYLSVNEEIQINENTEEGENLTKNLAEKYLKF